LKVCFRIVVEDPAFAPKAFEAVRDLMEDCADYNGLASGPSWLAAFCQYCLEVPPGVTAGPCYSSLVIFSAATKPGSLGILGKSTMSLVVEANDPPALVHAIKRVVSPLPSILRGFGYVALDTSCSA